MTNEFWRNFWRRKTKFIDRKQQTRFAIEVLVIMVLFPILFFTLVIVPPFSTIFLGKNAEVLSTLFINQLNMIAGSSCDNCSLKERVCGAGCSYGICDAYSETWNEGAGTAMCLSYVAFKNHWPLYNPFCGHNSNACFDI